MRSLPRRNRRRKLARMPTIHEEGQEGEARGTYEHVQYVEATPDLAGPPILQFEASYVHPPAAPRNFQPFGLPPPPIGIGPPPDFSRPPPSYVIPTPAYGPPSAPPPGTCFAIAPLAKVAYGPPTTPVDGAPPARGLPQYDHEERDSFVRVVDPTAFHCGSARKHDFVIPVSGGYGEEWEYFMPGSIELRTSPAGRMRIIIYGIQNNLLIDLPKRKVVWTLIGKILECRPLVLAKTLRRADDFLASVHRFQSAYKKLFDDGNKPVGHPEKLTTDRIRELLTVLEAERNITLRLYEGAYPYERYLIELAFPRQNIKTREGRAEWMNYRLLFPYL